MTPAQLPLEFNSEKKNKKNIYHRFSQFPKKEYIYDSKEGYLCPFIKRFFVTPYIDRTVPDYF